MFTNTLIREATELLEICRKRGLTLSTAESCTGGLISVLLTEIPGASDVFDKTIVTYSNEAKTDLLGVDKTLLEKHGGVSEEVALSMAKGVCKRCDTHVGIAVTGIAGPSGGTPKKPVGTVVIAVALGNTARVQTYHFSGDRNAVRINTVEQAIALAKEVLTRSSASSA